MIFSYEAISKEGIIEKGEFQGANKQEVIEFLEKKGLTPISIKTLFKKEGFRFSFRFFEKFTTLDKIFLVRNLSAMLKAGISISQAIDIVLADATKKTMRDILLRAQLNLQSGQPLSVTFSSYKKLFPSIFIGMLKAGEVSGQLSRVLDELASFMLRDYNLTRKVRSALMYPILLLIGSIGVIILLLTFVLPRLAKVFEQSGTELPFITKIIISISKFFSSNLFLVGIIIGFLIWFFISFRKTSLGQRIFLWISFHLPIVKELSQKIALVRFSRTLGSLISSGISFLEALELTAQSVGNRYYEKAILESLEQVKNGVPFSKTFSNNLHLFPRSLISLIAVGEKTGTLDNILKKFADFYDEEIDDALKDLTTFLEPVLLLTMGLVIGAIALSILLPIYQLVGKLR